MFALVVGACAPALAQPNGFPFDSELFLDARPLPGSKRIPNVEIAGNGAIVLEMWCNKTDGQFVVAGDTVTVMLGQQSERPCTPAQAERDAELVAALNGVTNWRRAGDDLLLIGPRTLRFKPGNH
jgi:heat shock protein HslJ